MSCNGPCDQGRKPCPTPAACQVFDERDLPDPATYTVLVVSLIACILFLCYFLSHFI